MTESCIGGNQNCRSLCWDEQNRLQGVKDNKWLSYYQYDAAGDRTYKLTGKGDLQNISGEWRYFYYLEKATLYASPYLVAAGKGYTKHYYAESERIASRIGGGRLSDLDQPVVEQGKIIEKKSDNKTYAKEVLEECLDAMFYQVHTNLYKLYRWRDSLRLEADCYWYHPDHLGSSSWITDTAGAAVQHLHYLPWGEDFVDQRTGSFSSMYTFSAKEKDAETGYSYFGARYYSSDLSVWLSVDPMSDKYASLSPYTYCADNPVRLVDPNGEEIGNYYDTRGNFIGSDAYNDGKIYLVSNQQGISKDEKGNIVVVNPIDVHELPDKTARGQIIDQLIENDSEDPNSESGGCYGATWYQQEQKYDNNHVEWGETQYYDPPCDITEMKYPQVRPLNFKVLFDFHSHGSGVCKVVGSDIENSWGQKPGEVDKKSSSMRATAGRTFAVFGMRFEKVYFYNEKGIYATWSFNQFRDNE